MTGPVTVPVSIEPAPSLRGGLRVPGDKSASHRALMISALASGSSTIEGLSPGHDVRSTGVIIDVTRRIEAEQQLAHAARHDALTGLPNRVLFRARRSVEGDIVTVTGPANGLHAANSALDCGNSGTTMRLMCGLVSAIGGAHHLVGDPSLSKRPMDRVAVPLGLMGASVRGVGERITAPLSIEGSWTLQAIDYHVPMPSAQVKSALLFAGLGASGDTVVREDVRTRTTTEDMFAWRASARARDVSSP